MAGWVLGVIGGSGLYGVEGLANARWTRVDTPFGAPSDELLIGELGDVRLVFLPRHGRGHPLPPSAINARANIDALKRAGVTDLVSIAAVGSLREALAPGQFVVVDQFIDRTYAREPSFFGPGLAAHVSMGDPVCHRLSRFAADAARAAGAAVVEGGTYIAIEGPQFSTKAESELYRSWGCDVIGMTGMPEARLAREAELCYATVAMVTDYDCWHPGHDAVSVDMILSVLQANAERARALVRGLVPLLARHAGPCRQGCDRALEHALITAPERRDPAILSRLDAVAGRVLKR